MKKILMICITAAVMMAPLAAYAHPVRVFVGRASGGLFAVLDPYPYPYGYYGYGSATGAVKFDTKVKDAEVYIDGAYARTVGKLKTMYLRGQLRDRGPRTGTHALIRKSTSLLARPCT